MITLALYENRKDKLWNYFTKGNVSWNWKKPASFMFQRFSLIQGKLVPHFSNDFVTTF